MLKLQTSSETLLTEALPRLSGLLAVCLASVPRTHGVFSGGWPSRPEGWEQAVLGQSLCILFCSVKHTAASACALFSAYTLEQPAIADVFMGLWYLKGFSWVFLV